MPQITLRKRRHGTWQQVTEPMFPGYIFAGVLLGEQDIAPIRSTVGCLQVVRFGGHLIPLPVSVMQSLLRSQQDPLDTARTFRAGERLRVESGPFEGLEAVFDQPRGEDRVQVLITVLGGLRRVEVATKALSPL